jgi:hypothetical protein
MLACTGSKLKWKMKITLASLLQLWGCYWLHILATSWASFWLSLPIASGNATETLFMSYQFWVCWNWCSSCCICFGFVGTDGCLHSVVVEFSLQAHRYGVEKCACAPSVLSSIHQGHGGKFALLYKVVKFCAVLGHWRDLWRIYNVVEFERTLPDIFAVVKTRPEEQQRGVYGKCDCS